jgi:KDO2-lipid IV(A) lauroyltransferase
MTGARKIVDDSTDLRAGGTWTPLQRVKNDAVWAIASLAIAAARRLPLPLLQLLGRSVGAAAHRFAAQARDTALSNVARVFPELDDRQRRAFVRRSFRALGECLGETVALLHPSRSPPPLPLSDQARVLLERARAEGRGIVFASAHLGPWERVAASLVAAGVPLVTVARESYDPRFSRMYETLRSAHGVRVVWRATPGAAVRIVRTLRAGGVLGMPMDLRARVSSLDVPFLGHDAPTAVGPARIALRTGAAVIVGTAAPARAGREPACLTGGRNDMREIVVTATRIPTSDLPPGSQAIGELTSRINRELSHRILALPHAWVWMHERWRSQTGV